MKASKFLQSPSSCAPNPLAQTRVQFHQDQAHVLVVHETQLAIYEASKLDCVKQVLSFCFLDAFIGTRIHYIMLIYLIVVKILYYVFACVCSVCFFPWILLTYNSRTKKM